MGGKRPGVRKVTARVKPRVLVVATHPVQYQSPWYRSLTESGELDLEVVYLTMPNSEQQGVGFGIAFEWDIPLLDGYQWSRADDVAGSGDLSGFRGLRLRRPLALLDRYAPDVVLLTGWHSAGLVQLLFAARWRGIPVLVRGDSNNLCPRGSLKRLFHRFLISRYDGLLCVGRSNRDFYLANGARKEQLFLAPHFVDNERFAREANAAKIRHAELRTRWDIPSDAFCFLYCGKLEPKKRLPDLLAALKLLSNQASPRVHLLIVGSGELEAAARTRVAEQGLPATFAGFRNQMQIAEAYVATDCLVMASDCGETWGLAVNEAMVCGRPAIVSDRVGCGEDLVFDGKTGYRFPFGDVASLAESMTRVASDPVHASVMGDDAMARVVEQYSVQVATEGTISSVRALLEAKPIQPVLG